MDLFSILENVTHMWMVREVLKKSISLVFGEVGVGGGNLVTPGGNKNQTYNFIVYPQYNLPYNLLPPGATKTIEKCNICSKFAYGWGSKKVGRKPNFCTFFVCLKASLRGFTKISKIIIFDRCLQVKLESALYMITMIGRDECSDNYFLR